MGGMFCPEFLNKVSNLVRACTGIVLSSEIWAV